MCFCFVISVMAVIFIICQHHQPTPRQKINKYVIRTYYIISIIEIKPNTKTLMSMLLWVELRAYKLSIYM